MEDFNTFVPWFAARDAKVELANLDSIQNGRGIPALDVTRMLGLSR